MWKKLIYPKKKAEKELNNLNSKLDKLKQYQERCNTCPVNYEYYTEKELALSDMSNILEECIFAELGMFVENDEIYLSCENNADWCEDVHGYRMWEYEVTI